MNEMSIPRLFWLDDSDHLVAERKLAALRKQFSEWEWSRFIDDFPSDEEALMALLREVGLVPMFAPGKVVCCHGLPGWQDALAKEVGSISKNVLLILVAPLDESCALFKAARKEMGDLFRADKTNIPASRKEAAAWAIERAKILGCRLDGLAGKVLVDQVGIDPNRLTMEIGKLRDASLDGNVMSWLVEQACHGTGEADEGVLRDAMLEGDGERVHEFLRRLLDRGDAPLRILGLLTSWMRGFCVAESCGCNFEKVRTKVEGCRAFSRPGAVYYSCANLAKAKRPPYWAHMGLLSIYKAQKSIRKGDDEAKVLHDLFGKLSERSPDG